MEIYDESINDIKLIENGVENGYEWIIISMDGSHPCAYIVVDETHSLYKKNLIGELENIVHGGITFSENHLKNIISEDEKKWVIGWDYAHSGDYTTQSLELFSVMIAGNPDWGSRLGKKYTIEEIKKDIKSFVEYI